MKQENNEKEAKITELEQKVKQFEQDNDNGTMEIKKLEKEKKDADEKITHLE